VEEYGNV
jgi:cathepsin X